MVFGIPNDKKDTQELNRVDKNVTHEGQIFC